MAESEVGPIKHKKMTLESIIYVKEIKEAQQAKNLIRKAFKDIESDNLLIDRLVNHLYDVLDEVTLADLYKDELAEQQSH